MKVAQKKLKEEWPDRKLSLASCSWALVVFPPLDINPKSNLLQDPTMPAYKH